MKLVLIADFTTDGVVDWTSYNKACRDRDQEEKDQGNRCYKCGTFTLFGKGYPQTCSECEALHYRKDEVYSNPRGIRCPKCGHVMNDPYEIGADIYQEGLHDIICNLCDHEFEVETHVEYSWTSPARFEEEDEEEPEETEEDEDDVDDQD